MILNREMEKEKLDGDTMGSSGSDGDNQKMTTVTVDGVLNSYGKSS